MPLYANRNNARVARNFNSSAAIGRPFFNISSQMERARAYASAHLLAIKKGPATTTSPDMEKPPTRQERRLVDTVYITKPPPRKRGVIKERSVRRQPRPDLQPPEAKGGV